MQMSEAIAMDALEDLELGSQSPSGLQMFKVTRKT